MDLVQHDINEIKTKKMKNPNSNLENGKQEVMKYPAKPGDIIITTVGKRGAVVIMDTENCIKEAKHQLSHKLSYKILQLDPNLQHNKIVNDTLDRIKNENLVSKKTAELIKSINPIHQNFKIQKENNPGRTVFNPGNHHTSEILRFVDYPLTLC